MDATEPHLSVTPTIEEMVAEVAAKEKKADSVLVVGLKNQKDLDLKGSETTLLEIAKDQPETLIATDLAALLKAEEMVAEKELLRLVEKEDLLEKDQAALDHLVADRAAEDLAVADLVAAAGQAAAHQIHQNAGINF